MDNQRDLLDCGRIRRLRVNTMRRPVFRHGGFTLIELLVTLAVAAILMAVAAPSLLSSIGMRAAQSVGSQFVQDAAWVRQQAIAGAQPARITLYPNCAYTANVAGHELAAHSRTSSQIAGIAPGMACSNVPESGLVLSFDSAGLIAVPPGQTSNAPTVVEFSTPAGGSGNSTVQIFGSGIMLWNPQNAS
jgi:type IV fimbrial biogenesis protein FimT